VVYGIVFAMGIYYMNRLINKGPQDHAPSADEETLPNRPIAAAHGAGREALGR
jgi:cytochrome d ubiquinol oxidase subunit I